jgi:hypothetical protein
MQSKPIRRAWNHHGLESERREGVRLFVGGGREQADGPAFPPNRARRSPAFWRESDAVKAFTISKPSAYGRTAKRSTFP